MHPMGTAWTGTALPHATTGASHAGTTATVHSTLTAMGAALSRSAVGTRSPAAPLKVLTAIRDVFLEELGEFLDLLFGERKLCGHLVHTELRFLLNGELLGFLAMVLARLLAFLPFGRLSCRSHANGKGGSDESDSFHSTRF